jgi:hypothetical protein
MCAKALLSPPLQSSFDAVAHDTLLDVIVVVHDDDTEDIRIGLLYL